MKSIVKISMDNSFTNKYKRRLTLQKAMNYDNIFSTLGHHLVKIVKQHRDYNGVSEAAASIMAQNCQRAAKQQLKNTYGNTHLSSIFYFHSMLRCQIPPFILVISLVQKMLYFGQGPICKLILDVPSWCSDDPPT